MNGDRKKSCSAEYHDSVEEGFYEQPVAIVSLCPEPSEVENIDEDIPGQNGEEKLVPGHSGNYFLLVCAPAAFALRI